MTIKIPKPPAIPPLDLEGAHRRFKALLLEPNLTCACCHGESGLPARLESSRTAYAWTDKTKPNPNAPIALCATCAEEHHVHWDDMWNEYRTGQM
jgi:hypothetical protein